jgi:hypothetical protein
MKEVRFFKDAKFFDVQINSKSAKFSMQPTVPTINGVCQPMELLFCIDSEKGKPIVMDFNKDEARELLEELQRLVPIVECFG